VKTLTLGIAIAATAVALAPVAPVARADMATGNYEIAWDRPWDFHTYVLQMTRCFVAGTPDDKIPGCLAVSMNPRPIAKATQWDTEAHLANGRYTLTVDVPFGYWCNGYYGPVVPTRDVYTWDEKTLAGTMDSSFEAGPCGEPGGTISYPFTLIRM
jgi:hypothetical protein